MAKAVYDVSATLTQDQKDMANFWKDVPGATSPGHWLSILQQTAGQRNASLAEAALAYALTGAAINDALITCFVSKYEVSLIRPVSYIRGEMGHKDWSPFLGTPGHPEFPSAHSSLSAAAAGIMEEFFGKNKSFTDHTYDYLGYPVRSYPGFSAIAIEAGQSRLYAGIHYQFSIDAGIWQGKKVAGNILSK
jgi:membrane-associated phospholipid phosphatase